MTDSFHLTWLQAVLTMLAVHRLSVLVTKDIITQPVRKWIDDRFTGKLVDFIFCPWCVSIWIAAGAVPLTIWCWVWWGWVALGLAASSVAGFFAELV